MSDDVSGIAAYYNNDPERERQLWLDLLHKINREESILGASRHLLYIGMKRTE